MKNWLFKNKAVIAAVLIALEVIVTSVLEAVHVDTKIILTVDEVFLAIDSVLASVSLLVKPGVQLEVVLPKK